MKLLTLFEDVHKYTLFKAAEPKEGRFVPGFVSDNVNQASVYAVWLLNQGKNARIYKIEIDLLAIDKHGAFGEDDWDKILQMVPTPGIMSERHGEGIITAEVDPVELKAEEFIYRLGSPSGSGGGHNRDNISDWSHDFVNNIGKIYPGHEDAIFKMLLKTDQIDSEDLDKTKYE